MNKHVKLGIIIAPFLAIGGYVASDYYMQYKTDNERYHAIKLKETCYINRKKCMLSGAGLSLELINSNGVTEVSANYPLDSAAIAVVSNNQEKPVNLKASKNKKQWSIPIDSYIRQQAKHYKIRIVVTANNHVFFSEFTSDYSF